MHGIFTRVFLSFWTAIVLIVAAAVAITALNFMADDADPDVITRRAGAVLQAEGLAGLQVWLKKRNERVKGQRTFILDEHGRDILGRKFELRGPGGGPPGLPPGPPDTSDGGPMGGPFGGPSSWDFPRPPQARIQALNGTVYHVVFDPPPHRGPFSPPFSWPVRGVLLALAIAISGLVSYLLARSISSPLQNLQSATRALSTGNLSARAAVEVARRKDEFGTLAREFDSMAERLSALITARQQLLRDISHELRSPIARQQMALQLLRQDASTAESQLDRIERESERLERLVDQILEYARLERDTATLTFEEIDVVELTRQIVHDASFESQSAPGRLRFTHPDEILLRADPNLIHAAIDNVVRNALIHGSEESPLEIDLRAEDGEARLAVRDHGPGVPEAELEKIFEPFYRVVTVKSDRSAADGSGIGLAVTSRAVELHGGRVKAVNAQGGGLLVMIALPLPLA